MRIALISDIHGNLPALEAVAADIRRRSVDQVINLGDTLSGPLLPLETAQYVMAQGWLSLAGNHERQLLTFSPERMGESDAYAYSQLTPYELTWLRSLAPSVQLSPEVFLCHGTPKSDVECFLDSIEDAGVRAATRSEVESRLGEERSEVVACGHTHVSRAIRSNRGQLLINPGSVGLPAYDGTHPQPFVVETGSPDARYAIVEKAADGWVALLLSVPYGHKAMAQLAQSRGRPDWERALLTGYMR